MPLEHSTSPEPPDAVYEAVAYAPNLDEVTAFYRDVLGLRLVDSVDGLMSAFRLGDGQMFLLFDPRRSSAAGRSAPPHGAVGPGHLALRVSRPGLDAWRARLHHLGIAIEQDHTDGRAEQLYLRDPAGNSVELVAGELWPG